MPVFTEKYTDEDFLNALNGGLKTVGYVTKKVGSARKTAETYLKRLEESGKVERVAIDDGAMFVWKIKE